MSVTTTPTNTPLLCVEQLTVALPPGSDRPHAVKDLSFDLRAGEILCIVGESGSGKSISANAIMGLLPMYLKRHGVPGTDVGAQPTYACGRTDR